jgi:hypothetical protein
VHAFLAGVVVEVVPQRGAVIVGKGTVVNGVFGVGGECWGELAVAVETPDAVLSGAQITPAQRGQVVVAGAQISRGVLDAAEHCGVAALVAGGVDDHELSAGLTGTEDMADTSLATKGVTVVITGGFGSVPLDRWTFAVLQAGAGMMVSVSAATQIRSGGVRPEILIPLSGQAPAAAASTAALAVGDWVRLGGSSSLGSCGRIVALPVAPQTVDSEIVTRIAVVELDGNHRVTVPRANLEPVRARG